MSGADTVVLLALYNGAAHLRAQLDSLAAQEDRDWDLVVSDDGSTDQGLEILARWAADTPHHAVKTLPGPRKGFVANFFHLLIHVPAEARHAALCDQDDVWFPDKLSRAKTALSGVPEGIPAVYCARTMIADADLVPRHPSRLFRRPFGFRNALVQSVGGGNTMVLNRAAIDLLAKAIPEAGAPAVHDWWIYQIITGCGGQILRDEDPVLLYRQHGANQIGANTNTMAQLSRLHFILAGRFRGWNAQNLTALRASAHRFTPEAQAVLADWSEACEGKGPITRLRALWRAGVYRQGRIGTVALTLAAVTGRL